MRCNLNIYSNPLCHYRSLAKTVSSQHFLKLSAGDKGLCGGGVLFNVSEVVSQFSTTECCKIMKEKHNIYIQ